MHDAGNRSSAYAFVQFGKDIATVIVSTLAGYLFVQLMSLSVIERKIHFLFDDTLMFHLFSYQMIPSFIGFAVLIASVYYLYQKTKRTMSLLQRKEIEVEREKAALEAVQTITAMMIGFMSGYNGEIKDWIQRKNSRGERVPVKVAVASDKISLALESMSEMSYLFPYIKQQHIPMKTYTAGLEERLKKISRMQLPLLKSES